MPTLTGMPHIQHCFWYHNNNIIQILQTYTKQAMYYNVTLKQVCVTIFAEEKQ